MPISAVAKLTAELVQRPSVLGDEGACAEHVVDAMRGLGYDFVEIDTWGNAAGVINGAAPGPTLLFDGHLDTIDVHPRSAWTRDPFGAEIAGGKMYGRGTSDMKGAVAAMILGAAQADRRKLRGRIVVSASVGEEQIEGAALRTVLERHPADYVVIGESTDLNLVHGGRGRAEFQITTHGRPAHASVPHEAIHAVMKMMNVIESIEWLAMPEDPVLGRGVMALTAIISEPYPAHSVIPSACHATYERRLVTGETRESVLRELRHACEEAGAADTDVTLAQCAYETYTGIRWRQDKWLPAWSLPVEHPFVGRAKSALESIGLTPELKAYQFCTNAAYSAGERKIPTIGFGPSSEKLAHISDEYIEVEQLERAQQGYTAIAEGILGIK